MITKLGCSAIIHRNKNKSRVLIARRSPGKGSYPGSWETIGGTLEEYELPVDCILREVNEEIGLRLFDISELPTDVIYRNGFRYVIFNYVGFIDGQITLRVEEIDKSCWITNAEVESYDFFPGIKERILAYFSSLGQTKQTPRTL